MKPPRILDELEPVFHPRSIAVIGATADSHKMGFHYVRSLIEGGYAGRIYPVNPSASEIQGLKAYPSLSAVPGEVDLVIVSIPRTAVLALLDECAAKRVKAVHFFTAGFRELGDETGIALEAQMVEKARRGGFRIIGPNCLGIYSAESRIPIGPTRQAGKPGNASFAIQSGGLSEKMALLAGSRNLYFGKGVSYGNGIDLDAADYLDYFAADPATQIIGLYIEGTRDGARFLRSLQQTAAVKPLVAWKGGATGCGAATAVCHTGAMATPAHVWTAAFRQAGVPEVYGLDELADALLAFQVLGRLPGKRAAVLTGVMGGGGGAAVAASDALSRAGLEMASILPETGRRIASLIGEIGSIFINPVDVSQARGRLPVLRQCLEALAADPGVDFLLVQEEIDVMLRGRGWEDVSAFNAFVCEVKQSLSRPLVMVLPTGLSEEYRQKAADSFTSCGIPVFPSATRAAGALAVVARYQDYHRPAVLH